jgi:hypothetical protein
MKRIALCVLAVALLVSFSTAIAYADTTSGYETWSTASGTNNVVPTPHKGFTTTTVKCAVCHAVHKGTSTGQVLLRGTAIGACEYCHITNFIGNFKLYGGVAANYSTGDSIYGHSGSVGARCVDCHAVHGAGTVTNANFANVTSKILKSVTGGGVQTNPALPASYALATGTVRDGVITAFCTQCHPYYQPSYNGTIGVDPSGIGQGSAAFQSHIMGAAGASYGNPDTAYTGSRVANVESSHCRDCHDAGYVNESASYVPANAYASSQNFPHFTNNQARFMYSAAYSGATTATLTNPSADGACLKCHVWNGGADGVEFDF